jgi:hypothetical protein
MAESFDITLITRGARIGLRPIDWRENLRIRGGCDRLNERVIWTREKESIDGKTTTEV